MTLVRLVRAFALALVSLGIAQAGLITSSSQIGQPQTVINFSQFAGANAITTMGPVAVASGVTFRSTNPDGSTLGQGPYSFNDNGTWNSSVTFAGLNVDQFGGDRYTMTFSFAHPVSAVGGLLNYAVFQYSGFSDVVMNALAANGSVLETYDISAIAPISTPNAVNGSEFRGIEDSRADIFGFSLSNSAVALTDLTFSSTIPEPSTWCLLLAGLCGLLLSGRPRRRQ